MSKPETCPNCNSNNLYRVVVNATGLGGGLLPLGVLNGPRFENRVCGECGLTQWFVAKEQLYLLKDHLDPVDSAPSASPRGD